MAVRFGVVDSRTGVQSTIRRTFVLLRSEVLSKLFDNLA